MAHSPVLHVKDGYYFEVPKFMWRYEKMGDVPAWLRDKHHMSLAEWKHELDGKILIPQPLGTLKNLHERQSGFCISKFMILEVVAAFVIALVLIRYADRVRHGKPPKGAFWHFIEAMLLFIRDQVARPAIPDDHGHGHDDHGHGEQGKDAHGKEAHGHAAAAHATTAHSSDAHAHSHTAAAAHTPDADRFLPFLWTLFFFLLGCNLLGMIPWMGSPTGAIGMTAAMAVIAFAKVVITGMGKMGVIGFFKSLVPSMDLPPVLAVLLMPMIFAIELLGLVIKHFVLAVRLMANMFAGHLVLAVILGFTAATAESVLWYGVMPASVLGSTALSLLELFVAFLQAYIFTFLTALFIGSAVHPH